MDPLTVHSPPFVCSADSETQFYFSLKGHMFNYWFYSVMNAWLQATFMAPPDDFSINTTNTAADLHLPPASEGHTEPVQFLTWWSVAAR